MKFSVLISVYKNDNADHFDQALASVTTAQTRRPDEVVLVVDGPIGDSLERVVAKWTGQTLVPLNLVRSEDNIGLAKALNLGLTHCQFAYVARMDSDDLSVPTRFADQIAFLEQNPDVKLVGGWYKQFDMTMTTYLTDRKVPSNMDDIYRYSRTRTPFNHVTAIFDKAIVQSVGGYPLIKSFSEDWWIALRLIKNGYRIANLPAYHVHVRGDSQFTARRGGWNYLRLEWANLFQMRREGLISTIDLIKNLVLRSGVRLVPNSVRVAIYRLIRKV